MSTKKNNSEIQEDVTQSFEAAMVELEALVKKIEEGDLSLEESLKEFEKGIQLSRVCQQALTAAEQRVKILSDGVEQEVTTDND